MMPGKSPPHPGASLHHPRHSLHSSVLRLKRNPKGIHRILGVISPSQSTSPLTRAVSKFVDIKAFLESPLSDDMKTWLVNTPVHDEAFTKKCLGHGRFPRSSFFISSFVIHHFFLVAIPESQSCPAEASEGPDIHEPNQYKAMDGNFSTDAGEYIRVWANNQDDEKTDNSGL